jgi:hypothetical protein
MKRLFLSLVLSLCILLPAGPIGAFTPPDPGGSFVYPNPATTGSAQLVFNMGGSGQVHIRIYNESCSLVMDLQQAFPAGVQQTPLSNFLFANGAYVYRIFIQYDSGGTEKLSGKFAVFH